MKNEIKYSFKKLDKAITRLEEGCSNAKDELDKDGVIKRFEFTFEIFWKTLKIFLEDQGILCKSPKSCLIEGFRFGMFSDEAVYLNMLEDRNLTSHVYDQLTSNEIFERIRKEYLKAFIEFRKKIDTNFLKK